MRIIAGTYSSRKLETKKGNSTRPTLDKVKEAIFSSLGSYFDGGYGLDLYAGSGAVGLEGLSRGLDFVYFSDNDREAYQIIKKNIEILDVTEQTKVYPVNDMKMLKLMKDENIQFRFVYLDPPYKKQKNLQVLKYLDDNDMIHQNGVVVIESLKEENYQCEDLLHLKYQKEAIYGITKVTYYKHV